MLVDIVRASVIGELTRQWPRHTWAPRELEEIFSGAFENELER